MSKRAESLDGPECICTQRDVFCCFLTSWFLFWLMSSDWYKLTNHTARHSLTPSFFTSLCCTVCHLFSNRQVRTPKVNMSYLKVDPHISIVLVYYKVPE